ncbi:MAG: hypothetical protein QW165_04590, partial [Candidatus Woesearchaeota archaeon]
YGGIRSSKLAGSVVSEDRAMARQTGTKKFTQKAEYDISKQEVLRRREAQIEFKRDEQRKKQPPNNAGPKEEFNPSGDVYPFSTPKTDFLHTLKGKKSEFKNLPQVTEYKENIPFVFRIFSYLEKKSEFAAQQAARLRSQGKSGFFEEAKAYGYMFINQPVGAFTSLYAVVRHPQKTAEGLKKTFLHPREAGAKFGESLQRNPSGTIAAVLGQVATGYLSGKVTGFVVEKSGIIKPRIVTSYDKIVTSIQEIPVGEGETGNVFLKGSQTSVGKVKITNPLRETLGMNPKEINVEIVTNIPAKTSLQKIGGIAAGTDAKIRTGFTVYRIDKVGKRVEVLGKGQQRFQITGLSDDRAISVQTDVLRVKSKGKTLQSRQQQATLLLNQKQMPAPAGDAFEGEIQRGLGFTTKPTPLEPVKPQRQVFTRSETRIATKLPESVEPEQIFGIKTKQVAEVNKPVEPLMMIRRVKGTTLQIMDYTGGTFKTFISKEAKAGVKEVRKEFTNQVVVVAPKARAGFVRQLVGQRKGQLMTGAQQTVAPELIQIEAPANQARLTSKQIGAGIKPPQVQMAVEQPESPTLLLPRRRGYASSEMPTFETQPEKVLLSRSRLSTSFEARSQPRQRNLPLIRNLPVEKQEPRVNLLPRARQQPRVQQVPRIDQVPHIDQIPRVQQVPRVQQIPRLQQIPRVAQLPRTRQLPRVPPRPGVPVPPPPPALPFDFGVRAPPATKKRKKFSFDLRPRTQYTPTIYSIALNIEAPRASVKQKGLSGLEVRPILKSNRRRGLFI